MKTIQKYAINPVQLKTIWLYTDTQAPPIKSINPVQLKTIQKYAINPVQLKTIWLYTGTQGGKVAPWGPAPL